MLSSKGLSALLKNALEQIAISSNRNLLQLFVFTRFLRRKAYRPF